MNNISLISSNIIKVKLKLVCVLMYNKKPSIHLRTFLPLFELLPMASLTKFHNAP